MSVIILGCCGIGKTAFIVKDDNDDNRVFDSVGEADAWSWDNADELGDCFRIVDLDD
ncbi:MAG: hypothetical protein P1U47_05305 [Zhongshania sp.]|uniref:hypothetical protein n=1 Tax=Zhongshania sp. TaxID=1971902 RepID=UPI002632E06E|nr:hypothetical protein [Zhongshania sp.]MDF1691765.1 hypothetical protein [Zhongshania sp.]